MNVESKRQSQASVNTHQITLAKFLSDAQAFEGYL